MPPCIRALVWFDVTCSLRGYAMVSKNRNGVGGGCKNLLRGK